MRSLPISAILTAPDFVGGTLLSAAKPAGVGTVRPSRETGLKLDRA